MSLLLPADVVPTLLRKEELFFIDVTCPVLQTQYATLAAGIRSVWSSFDADFDADVSVVAIDRYVTDTSTFVYALFYRINTTDGMSVSSTQVAAPALNDFASAVGQITCPQGGAVGVVDTANVVIRQYRSAFFSFLVAPVRPDDIEGTMQRLHTKWQQVIGAGETW